MTRVLLVASTVAAACTLTLTPPATAYPGLANSPLGPGEFIMCPPEMSPISDGTCVSDPGSSLRTIEYLQGLNKWGITYSSTDDAIAMGKAICRSINAGQDFPAVQLGTMRATNLNYRFAARMIVQAIVNYCPSTDDDYFHQAEDAEG